MIFLFYLPAALQGLVIFADEILFHRKRGLGTWEVWGHPLDTASVAFAYGFLWLATPSEPNALLFTAIAVLSSLLVTKDELVHAELCEPAEQWLHSLLFLLHPTAFAAAGYLWLHGLGRSFLGAQLALVSAFFFYQIFYWGIPWAQEHFRKSTTASTKPTATAGTPPTTTPSRS